jgi:hypothetical protein
MPQTVLIHVLRLAEAPNRGKLMENLGGGRQQDAIRGNLGSNLSGKEPRSW